MRIGDHEFEVSTEPYGGGWRSYTFLPGGKQRASATCDSREAAEMDLAQQLRAEFMPKFDPNRNYAESVVDELLEAMGRRGFLKRLGLGLAGAALAPAAVAAPAVAPAPAAVAAALPNLMRGELAAMLRQIRDRFVAERTHGWTNPDTGVFQQPVPLEQAVARWAAGEPRWKDVLIDGLLTDPGFRRRFMPNPDPQWMEDARQDYVRRHGRAPVEQEHPVDRRQREEREQMQARAREAEQAHGERQRIAQDQPEPDRQRKPAQLQKSVQVWPEREPRDQDEEAPWDMESKADKIVGKMLEDGEQLDAHVKAHERVQKWDGAHATYQKLYPLKLKAMDLFRQMGRAIGYERALAKVGLSKEDVVNRIHGAQIGATHNFKGQRTAKVCKDTQYCAQGRVKRKQTGQVCGDCGGPTEDAQVSYAPSELRVRYANYIFGVDTTDGRRVWFDEPVPPQPEVPNEAVPGSVTQEEREQQKRIGKWW